MKGRRRRRRASRLAKLGGPRGPPARRTGEDRDFGGGFGAEGPRAGGWVLEGEGRGRASPSRRSGCSDQPSGRAHGTGRGRAGSPARLPLAIRISGARFGGRFRRGRPAQRRGRSPRPGLAAGREGPAVSTSRPSAAFPGNPGRHARGAQATVRPSGVPVAGAHLDEGADLGTGSPTSSRDAAAQTPKQGLARKTYGDRGRGGRSRPASPSAGPGGVITIGGGRGAPPSCNWATLIGRLGRLGGSGRSRRSQWSRRGNFVGAREGRRRRRIASPGARTIQATNQDHRNRTAIIPMVRPGGKVRQ